jgi:RNA polymerase-binding transcription factor DksA
MNKETIIWIVLGVIALAYCSSQGNNDSTTSNNSRTSIEDQYSQDVADQAKSDWEIEQDAENFNKYVEEQNDIESQNNSITDIMLCADTGSLIGEYAFCKIPVAYCSYQPGETGSPTFCNDRPYPNNAFTLVVWGDDWSDYDGRCILVDGIVTTYNGKPQIIGTDRRQVLDCK